MAIKSNIIIDQGVDYEVTINMRDANTTPINLTGYTGKAQLRKYFTSSTSVDFEVLIAPDAGTVTLAMNSATTSTISPGRYVYDCVLYSNDNVVSRVLEGIVTITPQVTRNV